MLLKFGSEIKGRPSLTSSLKSTNACRPSSMDPHAKKGGTKPMHSLSRLGSHLRNLGSVR